MQLITLWVREDGRVVRIEGAPQRGRPREDRV
jgi:hypothetical protein